MPFVDTILSQSTCNKFVSGVKIKATSDSKLNKKKYNVVTDKDW